MIGPNPPCASTSFLRLLTLLLIASVSPLAAATALTNGHAILLSFPTIEEERTLLNGDDSFTIFVPEGATKLVVEFVTSPEAAVELMVEPLQARIFNLMFDIPTFQRLSASLFIGARAR